MFIRKSCNSVHIFSVAARAHSPEGSPTPKPNFFIELCELVNRKVPLHAIFVSEKIGRERMYWRELYRWVELEEMYDHVIGEFSPAEITRLDYRAICKFQTQLKQNFLLTRYACTDYEEFTKLLAEDVASFIQKRPSSFTPSLAKVLLAPRFHPQVEKRRFSVHFEVGHHTNANRRPINEHIAACCAEDTKSCCIMTGVLPLLPYDILILAQLENKMDPVGVVEVPYPLRLVVLALTPRKSNYLRMLEVAHTFGIFLNDKDFQLTCEGATSSDDLLDAIDVYLSKTVVMPRQRQTVLPFPTVVPHKEITIILSEANLDTALRQVSEDSTELPEHEEPVRTEHFTPKRCLHTVWPPMRDVVKGTCAVGRRFASDFADAFTRPNIGLVFGSIFLVYFVIFGPAITFGTLMNAQIHTSFSVSNSILTSGVVTIMNALFAGQPIAIIGPSGPSFIMEALIAQEAGKFGVELYDYRFWVCIYSVVCGIFLIALNLSEVATTTTKSLEELYSACIAGFLIIKALFSVFKPIPHGLPTGPGPINGSDLALLRTAATTGVTAFLALSMAVFCITVAQIKQSRMFRRKNVAIR
ncbi:Anion exchange protein 3 [Sparganum proliferum]